MYSRLFEQVCGMFNMLHLIYIVLFACGLGLLLFLSRRRNKEQISGILLLVGIAVTVMEIIKITVRIYNGAWPDSWLPLYYCSLFLFAIWFVRSKNIYIQRAGYAYMTMGGVVASAFFVLYPSTSLGMYPFIHLSSAHSLVYHLLMCYCGILVLWKGVYLPKKQDAVGYFCFITVACVLAFILNEWLGTNCMFLRDPFGLPVLQPILAFSKPLYIVLVALAQGVLMFWLNYGIYSLVKRRKGADKKYAL